jgi:hypothetical protein
MPSANAVGEPPRAGLSQIDVYQAHSHARADKIRYDRVLLLYPERHPIARQFSGEETTIFVRTVNVQDFHDPATEPARIETLQQALDIS